MVNELMEMTIEELCNLREEVSSSLSHIDKIMEIRLKSGNLE